MSALSIKTLERIAEGRVAPIARWKFFFLSSAKWIIAASVCLLAAFGIMLTVHVLFEIDWHVYQELGFTPIEILRSLSPLLWTGLLAVILIAGVALFRRTKYGYRYSLGGVFGVLLFSGLVMGATFERWPGEERIESALMYKIPGYRHFEARILPSVEKQWSQPEDGLLGGTITSIDEGKSFELRDFEDKAWKVDTEEAHMSGSVELKENQEIKIIGETEDNETFRATEVRSWESKKPTSVPVKPKAEEHEEESDDEEESEERGDDEEDEEEDEEEESEDQDEEDDEESEADQEDSEQEDED